MRRRNDRIKTEDDREQFFFQIGEMKNIPVVLDPEQFHSSRSIVACRLYFLS